MSHSFALFALFCFSAIGFADSKDGVDPNLRKFFSTHCVRCHGPEKQKGDFRIDSLKVSETPVEAEQWQLVSDKLNLGKMPPEKVKERPSLPEVEFVTTWIAGELRRAKRALAAHTGEVVLRRLNRLEYENTVEDLFGVRGDFAIGFPEDATADGFNNIGAALMLSAEQVSQYMKAADFILERAIVTTPRPETKNVAFTLADENKLIEEQEKRSAEYQKKNPPTESETKKREAERKKGNFGHNYYPKYGDDYLIPMRYTRPSTKDYFHVRHPGWYRFKVVGYAARNEGKVMRLEVSHGTDRKEEIPTIADVIQYEDETPIESEYRVYLQPNHRVTLTMLDGPNWMWGSKIAENKEPVIALRKVEMEGPLIEGWPPRGHRNLFGSHDITKLNDKTAIEILRDFAPRLFRRPVDDFVVGPFVAFYQERRKSLPPLDALKLTFKAMMTSPLFLYHYEAAGKVDDYALANRVSYFLWRSIPDDELLQLAASGMLSAPTTLNTQVDRLLADSKSERFLKDFVGQWLQISKVGEMQPDMNLYPEYDPDLERGMVAETESFIREILVNDLSLTNLIDSDWAMLNDRLARHYGIEGVRGNKFRKVSLDKTETVRGGILTHASILNLTSNGTVTSPVVRGVWILNHLLGTPPPPPPPDVPAIDPDIRGASTIQEQLAKHRSVPECNSCHQKIDPYGIALENFDVIGAWREKYRALKPPKVVTEWSKPTLIDGPAVVSNDEISNLGAFKNFQEFRKILFKSKHQVLRNVAEKLATFALGRTMDFTDLEDIDNIVKETKSKGEGMKTMLHALVQSPLFRKP
ncbi:MAG: DUF1592 domain-containing protein [Planctomycetota bacterium]|nr:DUF1592 domain-containing protein [Planctomycetota bacterium]